MPRKDVIKQALKELIAEGAIQIIRHDDGSVDLKVS
jgi:hypothetical protein